MLDSKDLESIRSIMEEKLGRVQASVTSMMKEEITTSENLVLGELERVQTSITAKIDKIQKNIEDLQQYYKITKLENDNTALLLEMIRDLSKRIEELEKKTA
jgi:hypothetical protein